MTSFARRFLVAAATISLIGFVSAPVLAEPPSYIIQISVDGLGSGSLTGAGTGYLQNLINANQVPNFQRLFGQGAYTFNARNDYDYSETIQNHVSMITSRGVYEGNTNPATTTGHYWTVNGTDSGQTIAANRAGRYVAGVFDVAHDNGLSTGLFATKPKFELFNTSYNKNNGAPDTTGPDNGRNKIDNVTISSSYSTVMSAFTTAMTGASPLNYSFVHFANPDAAGHSSGWGSTDYNNAVKTVDGYLGTIFNWIDNVSSPLHNKTAIILTSDHGGSGTSHSDETKSLVYTIPFAAWGEDVVHGELYTMNTGVRFDPGITRPSYSYQFQPIRHSDATNLALDMLSLGAIPGSTVNANQSLIVPEPSTFALLAVALLMLYAYRRRRSSITQ